MPPERPAQSDRRNLFRLQAACNCQPRFRNDLKNFFEGFRQVIDSFVVDPRSDEEKPGRNSTSKGIARGRIPVQRRSARAIRDPEVNCSAIEERAGLPVCHDALIGSLDGPPIRRHMIEALPRAILPPEIVRATFYWPPCHRVIPALLETVHGHNVRRTRVRTAPSPLHAIPEPNGEWMLITSNSVPTFFT